MGGKEKIRGAGLVLIHAVEHLSRLHDEVESQIIAYHDRHGHDERDEHESDCAGQTKVTVIEIAEQRCDRQQNAYDGK